MDLRNLSELKLYLGTHKLRLQKGLSQNFIIEKNILDKIVSSADIKKDDLVLEIGPGLGAITRTLLEKGAKVTAVELDKAFAIALNDVLNPWVDQLTVIHGDILDQEFSTPMKVVSNIPFQITSPIFSFLAQRRHLFQEIVLVIQDDMATRIQSKAGTKLNNSFAIFSQFYFSIKTLFKISNHCFFPKPKIDCAVISLKPHANLLLPEMDHDKFFSFVRGCFAHKRKMLRSTQKHLGIQNELIKIGHKETARAEDLSLRDYITLFRILFPTLEQSNP